MAASQKMTDYERRRLENIKRNQEMLAAFNIQSRLSDLSAASSAKRPRVGYKLSPEKKVKHVTPIVLRRSLRTQGKPPDGFTSGGLNEDFDESTTKKKQELQLTHDKARDASVPISMKDAFCGENHGQNQQLIEKIKSLSRKEKLEENADVEALVCDHEKKRRPLCSVDIVSMRLEPENVARVVPGRILNVKFIPTTGMRMVIAGNKFGNVGFWNADAKEDGDGIYLYQPHFSPISGILMDSFSHSKMITSCYDGFIKTMDIEKEFFDPIYSSDYSVYALSQRPDNNHSFYYAEGNGDVGVWDLRAGKSSSSWKLHEDRINSIDFNMGNSNIMATSSTDRTVSLWDMRNAGSKALKPLRTFHHKRAVHSAYFSPSGQHLASTSFDNKVGLLSGANYEDVSMVDHNNQTGRWVSSFRGIWGWDDSYIFIGNMQRGVDIISRDKKTVVKTLRSEFMSAIQSRFDAHPYNVGLLAGSTSGGQVYLWETS